MNITESIGFFSACESLEEALDLWSRHGTQMIAISEPKPVLIRQYHLDTGKPYLYHAHQCYVNIRYSPRGKWHKGQLMTMCTERYGTPEE